MPDIVVIGGTGRSGRQVPCRALHRRDSDIVARYLKAIGDPRTVVNDPEARYFGGRLAQRSLVPLGEARLGRLDLETWLRRSRKEACED